ncbi:MAG: 50S ribosomal protein L15 [Chloroflexi bacterium]|nr:50S ribosomal protein L15 [Chloroflexota bacterium]|tara:strand:- start:35 stop:478 length:444 start_codon:yes stop_codon:yes gene_type:complete
MRLHDLKPNNPGKTKTRVGRGDGSGRGTYSGRGLKGQKARSGGGVRPGFEGGQNPQMKGLPMLRGFKNPFRTVYQTVNLGSLAIIPDDVSEVSPDVLFHHGLIRKINKPVKILGTGALNRSLQIKATKFTEAARAKIEAAGGKVVVS